MPIYRTAKNPKNPYVMINKVFLGDNRLSFRGKGLLAYLLSKPNDWAVREAELVRASRENRDAVRTAIKELIAIGYIERQQSRNEKGQLGESVYNVYELPPELRRAKEKAPADQFLDMFSAVAGVERKPISDKLMKRLQRELVKPE